MTDIWIDPAELDAMAGVLNQQSPRVQEAVAGDLGLQGLPLPAHLGWVHEAAAEMAKEALIASLLQLVSAIDVGVRAGLIRTDQATATDVTAPPAEQGFVLSGSPQLDPHVAAVLAGGSTLGGGFMLDQVVGPDGVVRAGSGGINTLELMRALQGGNYGGTINPGPGLLGNPGLAAIQDLNQDSIGRSLQGKNETYDPVTNRTEFDNDKFQVNKQIENQQIEKQRLRDELNGR